MKNLFIIFCFFSVFKTNAGTLRGAWEMKDDSNTKQKVVLVASIDYLSISVYENIKYIRSYGGLYSITDEAGLGFLSIKMEFNDKHPDAVGETLKYKFNRKENDFTIENQLKTTWKRIDNAEGELAGLWQITARAQNGQMTEMKQGPRKTIKILTGTRFQWLAINPETKEFMGTGGGTYSLIKGKYTETIEFFSRDNTRVGATLSFDAKIEGNNWNHTGLSSKGDPVNEIWSKK